MVNFQLKFFAENDSMMTGDKRIQNHFYLIRKDFFPEHHITAVLATAERRKT
jgi:hypothetical protein